MENMNLLDLDNDILNIIGNYVKKDNIEREKIEEIEKVKQAMKEEIFYHVDFEVKKIRKTSEKKYIGRPDLRMCIYCIFSKIQINDDDIINEYLTLKKLNLKKKILIFYLINMYIYLIYILLYILYHTPFFQILFYMAVCFFLCWI